MITRSRCALDLCLLFTGPCACCFRHRHTQGWTRVCSKKKAGREPTRSSSGRACKKLELFVASPSQLVKASESPKATRLEPAENSVPNEPAREPSPEHSSDDIRLYREPLHRFFASISTEMQQPFIQN
jgi:hypothetical protein